MAKLRLGVLASGQGTNLQALIDAIQDGRVQAEIAIVISNHPEAYVLQRASRDAIPTAIVERRHHRSRLAHQLAIAEALRQKNVELVVLAGFDQVLVPEFIRLFPYRIINIHPSLLPAFGGGLHAQAEALEYGVKLAGCTVHFVTVEVDAGPIILQAAVPVLDHDTAETLAARILAEEHKILPQAVQLIAQGSVRISGRRVFTTKL